MALATYPQLVLRWEPYQKVERAFTWTAISTVVLALAFGWMLSLMPVAPKSAQETSQVPERVAKFVRAQVKPKPVVPPKPKPVPPPLPKLEPKPVEPKIAPIQPDPPKLSDTPKPERQRPQEPVTEKQQAARDTAVKSGLLAQQSLLADLIDTPDVDQQLNTQVNQTANKGAATAASLDTTKLTEGSAQGSGGVDAGRYATQVKQSQLAAGTNQPSNAALEATDKTFAGKPALAGNAKTGKAGGRSEEEVTLVMDRHKGQLQTLYNRARRSNPSLKGSLVLAVTIQPNGTVSDVKVLSSQLNDPALIASVVARVKALMFDAKTTSPLTVNYPIEFLP